MTFSFTRKELGKLRDDSLDYSLHYYITNILNCNPNTEKFQLIPKSQGPKTDGTP